MADKLNLMSFADTDAGEEITWLAGPQSVNGMLWLTGRGTLPCDTMFIGEHPGREETSYRESYRGEAGELLRESARNAGFDLNTCYFTYLVKYTPRTKSIKAPDIKACTPLLQNEIERGSPRLIITLGANALKAVMGNGYKISEYRGTALEHPEREGVTVFPLYNPGYIMRRPDAITEWDADFRMLKYTYNNETAERVSPEYVTCHTREELSVFSEFLFSTYPDPLIVIDCEWEGNNYMERGAYLRTVQLGYDTGKVLIVELFDEHGECMCTRPGNDGNFVPYMELPLEERLDSMTGVLSVLKGILERDGVRVAGHNVRADGQWLLWYGIDIRRNTWWDTMICEHTLDSRGPFGLNALTVQYTDMGRYDAELVDWRADNARLCINGFGAIPAHILLPYAACDVDAPRRIIETQRSKIKPLTKPRGRYPSLWDASMFAANALYEPENLGMLVDKERLAQLTEMYSTARDKVENKVIQMAEVLGIQGFNPRSVFDIRKLLFDVLDMTPTKTTDATGSKPWSWVLDQGMELQDSVAPSTDKDTLAILADVPDAHKIVGLIRDFRKVSYICSTWLVDPETAAQFNVASRGGGVLSKIWPDGRIHSRFSQLKETARLGSSKPNVQNWPKRAEGDLKRIIGTEGVEAVFGKGAAFPSLRSMIIPTPGYVLMAADWKQAEMYILAALSGDRTMYDALITPGKDLHDTTAMSAFGIQTVMPDGRSVSEEDLLALAQQDIERYGTCDGHDFDALRHKLLYVDQRGRKLPYDEFHNSVRVNAKNLNFGIPYGRGARSIALQVKAETGTDDPLPRIEADIDHMMHVWKTSTYPDAWAYMEECARAVSNPGYLINPWGRYRYFAHTRDQGLLRSFGREAQNYPIQSTVADTCFIALWMMFQYRTSHNLHFRFINQIHDEIVLEVPEDEIDATKVMFYETMGNIEIPIPNRPLTLGIDIETLQRWGD